MRKKKVGEFAIKGFAIKSFGLLVVLGAAYLGTGNLSTANLIMVNQAMAQDATTPYPNIVPMAPIDQYLMTDQGAEIALARSAAPESISRDAEVLVLGRMVSKRRSKAKTVSCVSWNVRGLPQPMLTFGIRKCGFRFVYNAAAARSLPSAQHQKDRLDPIKFRSHVDSATPRSTYQQRASTKASNSDPTALSI
jgi:hypothetical protein